MKLQNFLHQTKNEGWTDRKRFSVVSLFNEEALLNFSTLLNCEIIKPTKVIKMCHLCMVTLLSRTIYVIFY